MTLKARLRRSFSQLLSKRFNQNRGQSVTVHFLSRSCASSRASGNTSVFSFKSTPASAHFTSSAGRLMAPRIVYKPQGHLLVDEKLEISIGSLENGQNVTVYAYLNEEGKAYESLACFTADGEGIVTLRTHASQAGTYTGVSPMGLFWSMVACPGQMEGIRLMKKNVETPYRTLMKVYDGHLSLDEIREKAGQELTTAVIDRWYKSPGVTSFEVSDGAVRGKMFIPEGKGPFPGVIDLFGTLGGLTEFRSALLASRGIASLALPYFIYKDLPAHIFDVTLDYFLEAIDWLISQEFVIKTGIGLIGVSKGGDIVLQMGAYSPKVRAIVNINGTTFNVSVPLKFSRGDILEVPFNFDKFIEKDGKYIMKDCFEYTAKDITPVWKYNPKLLNILSEADMASPKECIRFLKEIYPKDKTDNCIILAYPDAGHLVEPPYTPLCTNSYQRSLGMQLWWGGYPEGHAIAQEDSWRRILKFFHEELRQPTAAKL